MIRRGNSKVGGVWTFSLPAVDTCPGSTQACRSACYATRGHFNWESARALFARNLAETRRRTFPAAMGALLRSHKVRLLRVHVSGDLYSAAYVRKWVAVLRAHPDVTAYLYTRSYRVRAIAPALAELAGLPNVRVLYSIDRDTGVPRRVPPGVRLAYLSRDDADLPPPEADLVFREHWRDRPKAFWMNGVLVCPIENGTHKPLTCETCRLCLDPARDPRAYKKPAEQKPVGAGRRPLTVL